MVFLRAPARHTLLEISFEHLLIVFVRLEPRSNHEVALGARDMRPALRPDTPVFALELPRPGDLRRGRQRIIFYNAVALRRARLGDAIDVVVEIAAARIGDFDDRLALAEIGMDRAVAAAGRERGSGKR